MLQAVAKNDGVVMVNFAPGYVSYERNRWDADEAAERARFNNPPYIGLYIGQPERAAARGLAMMAVAWRPGTPTRRPGPIGQPTDHTPARRWPKSRAKPASLVNCST